MRPPEEVLQFLGRTLRDSEQSRPHSSSWAEMERIADPFSDELSEDDALKFVHASLSCAVAGDKLKLVLWSRLKECQRLPVAFSVAASYYILFSSLPNSKTGPKKPKNSGRDMLIVSCVQYLKGQWDIAPTRNRSKHDDPHAEGSGCAIISWVLEKEAGIHLSEGAVEKIWTRRHTST